MSDTKPRDLTAEELALIDLAGEGARGSVPLRVPPGSTIGVELLNPAESPKVSFPSAGPGEQVSSGTGRGSN